MTYICHSVRVPFSFSATGLGALALPTGAQPQARVIYAAVYPDALGRGQASADYGTNGGAALVRSATIPARADTILVSSTQYDSAGNVSATVDPAGKMICFNYDNLAREVQRIMNCTMGGSSSSSGSSGGGCPPSLDTNVTIQTAYNGDGNVSQVTAVNSQTGNQVTQYVYGSTQPSSGIASSLLKVREIYPDSVSGSDQVSFTYNRQGELVTKTDQLGSVHEYDYDLLGRQVQDRITTLGTGVDNSVLRIQNTYEVRGMMFTATSFNNATVGLGTNVNQVTRVYNSFAQLTGEVQTGLLSPTVHYGYADGSANTIRPTSMTYQNGRVLTYDYGVAGGVNDSISRIASLIDNDGVTHLADYTYLGLGTIVMVNSPQPALEYTLVGVAGGVDPVTGDIYRGLDSFGRVKDLIWLRLGSSSSSSSSSSGLPSTILERIQHSYDRVGNRLYRAELADPLEQHDELYFYDGLNRLHDLDRGTLNVARTALTAETFAQCWGLDETGNWMNFREDDTGAGIWDLVQNRLSTPANEISLLNNLVGASWAAPVYDANGNMTTLPQPGNPGSSYTAVYDAWNRLISLKSGANLVQKNAYDGLNRRNVRNYYFNGALNGVNHYFYSGWQVIEEVFGNGNTPTRQFVWGLRYIDDLVIRERFSVGVLTDRFYGLQDPNWNMTAIADTSGNIQERYSYTGYGVPSFLTPAFGSLAASNFDWETLFAGYHWDWDATTSSSQLYHVRMRSYAPNLGSWLQRDLVKSGYFLSLYAYVINNPVMETDPLGLQSMAQLTLRFGIVFDDVEALKDLLFIVSAAYAGSRLALDIRNRINELQPQPRPIPIPVQTPIPLPIPTPITVPIPRPITAPAPAPVPVVRPIPLIWLAA